MKIKRIGFGLLGLIFVGFSFAKDMQIAAKNKTQSNKFPIESLNVLYSYSSFKFDASTLTTVNRFTGHYNTYFLGGSSIPIKKNTIAGLYVYRLDTYLKFSQDPALFTLETSHNDSLYGHILKHIKSSFFVDLLGGYGQSHLKFKTVATTNIQDKNLGQSRNHANNWFVGLKAYYSHNWTNFTILGNIGALHTRVNQNAFNFFLVSSPTNLLPALSSKATFILENAELSYTHNETITPFINGGLIQVVQNSTNNPAATALSVGSSPTQNVALSNSGFYAGGGFSLRYKQLSLRLEQQYYQRGRVYHSNQSIASLRFVFS